MRGRAWKLEAIVNYGLFLAPLWIGLVMFFVFLTPLLAARDHPTAILIATLTLYVLGAASFTVAKLSVIRKGTRFSVGSRQMTLRNRVLYWLGYALMIAGLLLHVGLSVQLGRA